jgi:hypothetical protein
VAPAADGALRCLPVTRTFVNRSLMEGDCTTLVAQGLRSSCSLEETLLADYKGDVCQPRWTIHRASRRLEDGYVKVDGCRPLADPFSDAYAIGDELRPGDFPTASRGILEGPGRLKRYATSTPAGTSADREVAWWDSKLGGRCIGPALLRDGTHRCVPETMSLNLFADPGCTRRVVEERPCGPTLFATEATRDGCSEYRHRVFRAGPVIAVDKPYLFHDGRCFESSLSKGATFREVGDEVDPSEFVQLTLAP